MKPERRVQLFLLPFAGGGAVGYRSLIEHLDPCIEAIPIEYAGRGARVHEAYIDNYTVFLNDAGTNICEQRNLDLPYALLGYSMGCMIAYHLVAKNILEDDPVHMFLCARDCVDQPSPSLQHYRLDDMQFVQVMRQLGGFDERLLRNERFLQIYLKPIREDYKVLGQFQYLDADRHLPCDATVIYSENDTPRRTVAGWDRLVDGKVDYYAMGENHFFIRQHYPEMADIINGHLQHYF